MKNITFGLWLSISMAGLTLLTSQEASSQSRRQYGRQDVYQSNQNTRNRKLPDGSIVYPDGSRQLPNGVTIDRNGQVNNGRQRKGTRDNGYHDRYGHHDHDGDHDEDRNWNNRNGHGHKDWHHHKNRGNHYGQNGKFHNRDNKNNDRRDGDHDD